MLLELRLLRKIVIVTLVWGDNGMKRKIEVKENKKGFTLIELSLSIAFISILSITIVMIINNTISSYRRGITLNQINTAGMDLVDDMRAAVQNSAARSVINECETLNGTARDNCLDDKAYNFVSVVKLANVRVGGNTISRTSDVPVYGAFCTGSYSYIWNSGYFFSDSRKGGDYEVVGTSMATLKYKFISEGGVVNRTASDFRLLKVEDGSRAVCMSAIKKANPNYYNLKRVGKNYSWELLNEFDITESEAIDEEPIDLLKSDDGGGVLAIYNLSTSVPAESNAANSLFYSVSFILGTVQGGINVKAAGNFCATPADYGLENFDYCAINKFNFAAQANGG